MSNNREIKTILINIYDVHNFYKATIHNRSFKAISGLVPIKLEGTIYYKVHFFTTNKVLFKILNTLESKQVDYRLPF